jgi:hypothetical protein
MPLGRSIHMTADDGRGMELLVSTDRAFCLHVARKGARVAWTGEFAMVNEADVRTPRAPLHLCESCAPADAPKYVGRPEWRAVGSYRFARNILELPDDHERGDGDVIRALAERLAKKVHPACILHTLIVEEACDPGKPAEYTAILSFQPQPGADVLFGEIVASRETFRSDPRAGADGLAARTRTLPRSGPQN